ncbi:hypothetical protein FQA39_LY19349 [Lamprigera yunnana]|nr:hypothetical protein FQA39_LY19349 [Lamprigera yunnana]
MLGRIDEPGGQLEALLAGSACVNGGAMGVGVTWGWRCGRQLRFESALALGDVWALDALWHELGFDALGAVFRRARFTNPVEHAVRVMVFNRLCDADSKLGVLRWLQTVSMPGIDSAKLTHQQLLRSMDALMDHQGAVDDCVAALLRPLIDEDLSVVFYDLTTIRAEGLEPAGGGCAPLWHGQGGRWQLPILPMEVFDGNTAEAPTLAPTLKKVAGHALPHTPPPSGGADRGWLSAGTHVFFYGGLVQAASEGQVWRGRERKRERRLRTSAPWSSSWRCRAGAMRSLSICWAQEVQATQAAQAKQTHQSRQDTITEYAWQDQRLVVAHNPERAAEQTQERLARIQALELRAAQLAGKLDAQEGGQVQRGRKLSDSGAKARFFHEVSEAHLSGHIRVDLKSDLFTYTIDEAALAEPHGMDGQACCW